MVSVEKLNEYFDYLSNNTQELLPDGILDINLKTLQNLHLLSENTEGTTPQASTMLQAVESGDKITLFNERFVLWIAPQRNSEEPTTFVYVARRMNDQIKPELGFKTQGIHNRSKVIVRLIDHFLTEIQETDELLSQLEGERPAKNN